MSEEKKIDGEELDFDFVAWNKLLFSLRDRISQRDASAPPKNELNALSTALKMDTEYALKTQMSFLEKLSDQRWANYIYSDHKHLPTASAINEVHQKNRVITTTFKQNLEQRSDLSRLCNAYTLRFNHRYSDLAKELEISQMLSRALKMRLRTFKQTYSANAHKSILAVPRNIFDDVENHVYLYYEYLCAASMSLLEGNFSFVSDVEVKKRLQRVSLSQAKRTYEYVALLECLLALALQLSLFIRHNFRLNAIIGLLLNLYGDFGHAKQALTIARLQYEMSMQGHDTAALELCGQEFYSSYIGRAIINENTCKRVGYYPFVDSHRSLKDLLEAVQTHYKISSGSGAEIYYPFPEIKAPLAMAAAADTLPQSLAEVLLLDDSYFHDEKVTAQSIELNTKLSDTDRVYAVLYDLTRYNIDFRPFISDEYRAATKQANDKFANSKKSNAKAKVMILDHAELAQVLRVELDQLYFLVLNAQKQILGYSPVLERSYKNYSTSSEAFSAAAATSASIVANAASTATAATATATTTTTSGGVGAAAAAAADEAGTAGDAAHDRAAQSASTVVGAGLDLEKLANTSERYVAQAEAQSSVVPLSCNNYKALTVDAKAPFGRSVKSVITDLVSGRTMQGLLEDLRLENSLANQSLAFKFCYMLSQGYCGAPQVNNLNYGFLFFNSDLDSPIEYTCFVQSLCLIAQSPIASFAVVAFNQLLANAVAKEAAIDQRQVANYLALTFDEGKPDLRRARVLALINSTASTAVKKSMTLAYNILQLSEEIRYRNNFNLNDAECEKLTAKLEKLAASLEKDEIASYLVDISHGYDNIVKGLVYLGTKPCDEIVFRYQAKNDKVMRIAPTQIRYLSDYEPCMGVDRSLERSFNYYCYSPIVRSMENYQESALWQNSHNFTFARAHIAVDDVGTKKVFYDMQQASDAKEKTDHNLTDILTNGFNVMNALRDLPSVQVNTTRHMLTSALSDNEYMALRYMERDAIYFSSVLSHAELVLVPREGLDKVVINSRAMMNSHGADVLNLIDQRPEIRDRLQRSPMFITGVYNTDKSASAYHQTYSHLLYEKKHRYADIESRKAEDIGAYATEDNEFVTSDDYVRYDAFIFIKEWDKLFELYKDLFKSNAQEYLSSSTEEEEDTCEQLKEELNRLIREFVESNADTLDVFDRQSDRVYANPDERRSSIRLMQFMCLFASMHSSPTAEFTGPDGAMWMIRRQLVSTSAKDFLSIVQYFKPVDYSPAKHFECASKIVEGNSVIKMKLGDLPLFSHNFGWRERTGMNTRLKRMVRYVVPGNILPLNAEGAYTELQQKRFAAMFDELKAAGEATAASTATAEAAAAAADAAAGVSGEAGAAAASKAVTKAASKGTKAKAKSQDKNKEQHDSAADIFDDSSYQLNSTTEVIKNSAPNARYFSGNIIDAGRWRQDVIFGETTILPLLMGYYSGNNEERLYNVESTFDFMSIDICHKRTMTYLHTLGMSAGSIMLPLPPAIREKVLKASSRSEAIADFRELILYCHKYFSFAAPDVLYKRSAYLQSLFGDAADADAADADAAATSARTYTAQDLINRTNDWRPFKVTKERVSENTAQALDAMRTSDSALSAGFAVGRDFLYLDFFILDFDSFINQIRALKHDRMCKQLGISEMYYHSFDAARALIAL